MIESIIISSCPYYIIIIIILYIYYNNIIIYIIIIILLYCIPNLIKRFLKTHRCKGSIVIKIKFVIKLNVNNTYNLDDTYNTMMLTLYSLQPDIYTKNNRYTTNQTENLTAFILMLRHIQNRKTGN